MKMPPTLRASIVACSVLVMIGCTTLAPPSAPQNAKPSTRPTSLVYALVSGRVEFPAGTGPTGVGVLSALVGMGFSIGLFDRLGVLACIDGWPMGGDVFLSGGITYDLLPDFLRVGLRGGRSLIGPAFMMSAPFILLLQDIAAVVDVGATIDTTPDATRGIFFGLGVGLTF